MKYLIVLGNNRALSLAELVSVLPEAKKGRLINKSIFLVETKKNLETKNLIKNLGGSIKIAEVLLETEMYSKKMEKQLLEALEPGEGKYKFGISNYAKFASPVKDKRLAMSIKRHLQEKDVSCRWVTSKEKTLSSVVVGQNLLNNGIEIMIAGEYKKCFVGRTLAVQDFKGLSKRDYGRPGRDDLSGMLPPKLAQIMINISGLKKGEVILDPFCGSGTVLTEAMLMGASELIGTDQSEKAVKDTLANIEWLEQNFSFPECEIDVFVCDARKLDKEFRKNSIERIVSEPYLGPQRGEVRHMELQKDLNELYTQAIRNFSRILRQGGRVVMVWPVRITKNKKYFLSPALGQFKKIDILPENLRKELRGDLSKRGNLFYGREGQRVWREILVLEKD